MNTVTLNQESFQIQDISFYFDNFKQTVGLSRFMDGIEQNTQYLFDIANIIFTQIDKMLSAWIAYRSFNCQSIKIKIKFSKIMKKLSATGSLILITSLSTITSLNVLTNYAYGQNMNSNDQTSQERALKFQAPVEAKKAFELGRKYDSQNLLQEAREQYSKAIEIYPNYAEAYLARSINLTDNNVQEALKDARKSLEIYTDRDDKNAISAVNIHIEMIQRGIAEGIFK